jgi:hypothetical protein
MLIVDMRSACSRVLALSKTPLLAMALQYGRRAMGTLADTTGWQTKILWTEVALLGAVSFGIAVAIMFLTW